MSMITAATPRLYTGCFLLAGLLVGALSLTPAPARAADAKPTLGGRIVFVRGDNLWLLDLDKQTEKRLTTSADCSSPSWSPDGTKVVYVRAPAWKEGQLWMLDVAAGTATKLTSKQSDYLFPRWSPDGKWIAVFAYDDGVQCSVDDNPSRLLKINLQTKAVTILQRGVWGVKSLAWAADGGALAYSYGTEGHSILAGILLENVSAGPVTFREAGGEADSEVTIAGVRWSDPEAISFYEFTATEESRLAIRKVTADGKVTTVRNFGSFATAAIPLSDTNGGDGAWLLTNEEGLWLWQNDEKAKLYNDTACEPAWSPAP